MAELPPEHDFPSYPAAWRTEWVGAPPQPPVYSAQAGPPGRGVLCSCKMVNQALPTWFAPSFRTAAGAGRRGLPLLGVRGTGGAGRAEEHPPQARRLPVHPPRHRPGVPPHLRALRRRRPHHLRPQLPGLRPRGAHLRTHSPRPTFQAASACFELVTSELLSASFVARTPAQNYNTSSSGVFNLTMVANEGLRYLKLFHGHAVPLRGSRQRKALVCRLGVRLSSAMLHPPSPSFSVSLALLRTANTSTPSRHRRSLRSGFSKAPPGHHAGSPACCRGL